MFLFANHELNFDKKIMAAKSNGRPRDKNASFGQVLTDARKDTSVLILEAELLEKKREIERLNLELTTERLEKDGLKEKTAELENWLSVFSEMNMS